MAITLNGVPCYPIWKDIEFQAQTPGPVSVFVFRNNYLLMTGELHTESEEYASGGLVSKVRVNEIIAPFVRPSLQLGATSGFFNDSDDRANPGTMPLFSVAFYIQDATQGYYFRAFADWSYDYGRGDIAFLPCPIDGVTVEGQYMICTGLNGTGVTFLKGGTVLATVARGSAGPATYFLKADGIAGSGAEQALTATMSGGTGGSVSFKWKRDVCARYVVYYVNAYGGWDWFVIQGKTIVSDTVKREDYRVKWSSALGAGNVAARERNILYQGVTKHYEMHTHWLTDDEASRMWHLTGSQSVYVHDLETGLVMPAVMTGTKHEYKTYRNQGGKLVSYQLDMDVAIDMQRR